MTTTASLTLPLMMSIEGHILSLHNLIDELHIKFLPSLAANAA